MKKNIQYLIVFLLLSGSVQLQLSAQFCNEPDESFCPGNFFQNGDFENVSGDPNAQVDQDIALAIGWNKLWEDDSFADLHCNGGSSSTGANPNPNTHVYSGIWIENRPAPVADNTYREGMYNYLDTPISQGSSNYSFDFKIANANIVASGSVEIGIYGVYNPSQVIANTPIGSSNNPYNLDLWNSVDLSVKVVLLGTISTPVGFTNTWIDENISFNSSILPTNGITHIMVTAYDLATPPDYRKIYVNFDEFCLQEESGDICDETDAVAIPDVENPFCCFDLELTNGNTQLFTDIRITPVGSLVFSDVVIDPGWSYSTNNSTTIQINQSGYIPTGTYIPLSLCIADFGTAPQQIQIEWIPLDGEPCIDIVTLECPKCMDIQYDTLVCDALGYRFDFDFTNVSDFNMEQLEIVSVLPNGTLVTPVILSIPAVTPGNSSTGHTFYFNPPAGTTFLSFQIKASSNDGCCLCISDYIELEIPDCPSVCDEPCELKSYTVNSVQGEEYCCSSIDITTECDSTFKCIELEVLSGAYFGTASAGSQWSIMNLSPTVKRWCPRSIFTGSDYIPAGTTTGKIDYCLKGFTSSPQKVVMRWIGNNGDVLCSDTIISECEPPPPGDCIIILDDTIKCVPTGGFAYCFSVQNVGMFTGNYIRIDRMHSKPGGAVFMPALVDTMVNLPINGTVVMPPINISNAMSGDSVCFVISVYDTLAGNPNNPDDTLGYNNCCHTDTLCIVLPPCEPSTSCEDACEKKLFTLINTGEENDCCYSIDIETECDSTFAAIELEVLNGGFFRSAYTPTDWTIMDLSTQKKVWKPRSIFTGSDYIPSVSGKINFCLGASSNIAQTIVMRWLDFSGQVICTDTITTECEILEGDCIVVLNDSIVCDTAGHYSYCFDIQNVGNFKGGFIKIHDLHSNPIGGVFNPSSIDTTINFPIGTTVTMPCIDIEGLGAGDEFCFVVSVYDSLTIDGYNHCCHSDTICVILPPCGDTACSDVEVSAEPASSIDGLCCYTMSVHNNYQANYFTSLRVFGLNPGLTLGFASNTADWNMTPLTGGGYEFSYIPSTYVPLGTSILGDFCLGNITSSTQTIEVQWLAEPNGFPEVVCCKAIHTSCEYEPDYPCMQIEEEQVYCDDTTMDGWYDFTVINNTDQGNTAPGFIVNMITVEVVSAPSTAVLSPLTFDYTTNPIAIGGSSNLNKIQINGVTTGDQICLRITGHNMEENLKKCCKGDEVICFVMPCDATATAILDIERHRVFPSPVKDILIIESINKSTDISIALYDIHGRLVYEQKRAAMDDSSIDMSIFMDGIYMLRLTSEHGQEVHKIIKSK